MLLVRLAYQQLLACCDVWGCCSAPGIRIIPGTSDPSFAEAKGKLVQQLVRPYLIDGRLWDIGACRACRGEGVL